MKDLVKHDTITHPNEVSGSIALVIGSRAHLEKESLATRSVFRSVSLHVHKVFKNGSDNNTFSEHSEVYLGLLGTISSIFKNLVKQ